jgi:hypothetical protein
MILFGKGEGVFFPFSHGEKVPVRADEGIN